MNQEQTTLFGEIAAHDLDGPRSTRTFVARLAQENGWSHSHAARVVTEYRRFVLLAVTGGHLCSPSRAVDQAWHLHLCDTRDYWERFCPQVLGRPLHHEPDRGEPGDRPRLDQAYRRTLASYRAVFASEPPADIWPPPPADAPVAPKPPRWRPPSPLTFASCLLLAGCDTPGGLIGVGLTGVIAWLIGLTHVSRRRPPPAPPPAPPAVAAAPTPVRSQSTVAEPPPATPAERVETAMAAAPAGAGTAAAPWVVGTAAAAVAAALALARRAG